MRNILNSLSLFVCVMAPVAAFSAEPASQSVYHARMERVLHMPEQPFVKVLLAKDASKLLVDVNGSHNIYDPYTGKKLEAAFSASSYPMTPTLEGIKWGQEFPGVYQIVIVPDGADSFVTVNGTVYPGVVAFYQIENKLAAVNWVSLDELTSSLLSSNFLPRDAYQKEAIAAYAIAIRSLGYQNIIHPETPFWDVKVDDCGYQGTAVARTDAAYVDALKATKRVVMESGAASSSDRLSKTAIDGLKQKMPSNDVEAMAKEGKDARAIINKFYPGAVLHLAEKHPSSK
jgi:stage II sporulation protein D